MSQPSKDLKTIARTVGDVFGGDWRVHDYSDDSGKTHIDLLSSADRPQKGISSYASLGVSEHPIYKGGRIVRGVRVELVGACASGFPKFANVVATAAFDIIKGKRFVAPGVIFPGAIAEYRRRSPMEHVMFVPPFLWPDLATLKLPKKTVTWLMLVPISEAEMKYAIDCGPAKLEKVFGEKHIDIYDIDRPSVV
jgi:hypothetical protein